MYDLLIKGGTVIDPAQGINGLNDVAVTDGKVARVAPNIGAEEATQVVEVRGKLVTPGLIDLHTHVYAGGAMRKAGSTPATWPQFEKMAVCASSGGTRTSSRLAAKTWTP